MSMGFSFGQKPNEAPAFGQTPFGSSQFGAAAPTATTTPQFSSSFGAKPASSGFQFSTPVSSSAFGSNFNFNSPATQANTATVAPSFGFGATPAYSFGATTTLPTALSYSTPSTTLFGTPLTTAGTATSSGFSLGAPKAAAPFGTSNPSSGLFAMPTTAPAPTTAINFAAPSTQMTSGISFGAVQPSMPKMSFGSSPAPPFGSTPSTTTTTGLSFGATPMTSAAKYPFTPSSSASLAFKGPSQLQPSPMGLNFSTPTSTPQTRLSFTPVTSNTISTGLGFGQAPATTVQSTGLGFTATTGLSFGTPASTALSTGISFGTPASTAPLTGFSLSQPASTATPAAVSAFAAPMSTAATTGLSFSLPASSATTTGINFGSSALASQTTAAPTAPTLSFAPSGLTTSASLATTTTAPTLLNFGTPATSSGAVASTTASPSPFGLGGISTSKAATSALPTLGFTSQPTTTTARTAGLGGVTSTPPKQTVPTTTGQAEVAPRDQPLPNEILQTVEQFKKFVQEQKNFSSEIARFSIKDLRKVENDVDLVNNCMNEVENQLWKNKAIAEKLKLDTAKDLQDADMAQRTFDTPAGLQYENNAPFNYFLELSDIFEKEMHDLKARIEHVNKHVKNSMAPAVLSPQDLALGMRRLHETFVTLAGRLQSVHSQVELQKEQYLSLRRMMLNDYTNVFEESHKGPDMMAALLEKLEKSTDANGSPTPFNSLRNSQVQTLAQNPSTAYPTGTTLGAPITTGFNMGPTSTMPLFGSTLTSTPSLFNQSSSNAFQLQKPPAGNKRGKP